MSAATSNYVPSSPSTFNFRPLSVGMITSETTMAMPNGSFYEVDGYVISSRGPKKLGGWEPAQRSPTTGLPLKYSSYAVDERKETQTAFRTSDGTVLNLLITNRKLYLEDATAGYVPVRWYAPLTVSGYTFDGVSVATLTISGSFSASYITTADTLCIPNFGEFALTDVNIGVSSMVLTFAATVTFTPTPTTVYIQKNFSSDGRQFVDFAIARNNMYFVDGTTRMIWKLDGTLAGDGNYYLKPHIILGNATPTPERTIMGAASITFFNERLYFAGILEQEVSGGSLVEKTYPLRVRWTDVLDHSKCSAAYYQDIIRSEGSVTKILGMGSLLMLYLTDGIHYGRSTNLTTLPYVFTMIETAGVSAIGIKAISTYFDGQVFLGTDNLYFIASDGTITPLGDKVADSLKRTTSYPYMSVVFVDTANSRIVCCVSNTDNVLDGIFFLEYHSNGWSFCSMPQFTAPGLRSESNALLYSQVSPSDTFASGAYTGAMYRSLLATISSAFPVCMMGDYMMRNTSTLGLNQYMIGDVETSQENPGELITPDFDFDDPDKMKTALRLSLKITDDPETVRTENVYCTVAGSKDRGATWKELGRMRIQPGRDEDALNFRLMGSTLRFRFRFGHAEDGAMTNIAPYTISEIILRIRERSVEAQRNNSRE